MKNFIEAIICSFRHKAFTTEDAAGDWVHVKCSKCKKQWVRFRI